MNDQSHENLVGLPMPSNRSPVWRLARSVWRHAAIVRANFDTKERAQGHRSRSGRPGRRTNNQPKMYKNFIITASVRSGSSFVQSRLDDYRTARRLMPAPWAKTCWKRRQVSVMWSWFICLTWNISQKFHPPKTYAFSKRKFGSKSEKQSCRVAWFEKYDWLHYDATSDYAKPLEQGRPGPPNFRRRFLLFLVLYTCTPSPRATDLCHRVPRRFSVVSKVGGAQPPRTKRESIISYLTMYDFPFNFRNFLGEGTGPSSFTTLSPPASTANHQLSQGIATAASASPSTKLPDFTENSGRVRL